MKKFVFSVSILMGIIMGFQSCSKSEIDNPPPTCNDGIQNQGEMGIDCGGPCNPCPVTTLGAFYGGGIVIQLDFYKQHGLILAPFDQHTGLVWAPEDKNIFANARDDFNGRANTFNIINEIGDGDYAAKICADLVLNGYDDWYLPAIREINKAAIFDTAFLNNTYWSSTEHYDGYTHADAFKKDGTSSFYLKQNLFRVRAVRSF